MKWIDTQPPSISAYAGLTLAFPAFTSACWGWGSRSGINVSVVCRETKERRAVGPLPMTLTAKCTYFGIFT